MGICCNIANSTLADANEQRDCRIDADFALSLIQTARTLYARERCAVELEQAIYALATTTIGLCVSVFPSARFRQAQAFFAIRAQSNFGCRRVYSRSVDKPTGLCCDQTIALTAPKASKDYPQSLRRIKFYDAAHVLDRVFLTSHFDLPALTIAQLYRCRWQVELFRKRIKQHLRIKRCYGTTANAVKTQIWVPSRFTSWSPP